jgi:plastocyanin
MSRLCSIKAKGAVCAVCLALPLLGLRGRAAAATITNILSSPGWQMQVLNIHAGDTVVWVNQQTSPPTNSVQSYGGEWSSPQLGPGDSFSFTFTDAGFYAYRTGMPWQRSGTGAVPGTITVSGWTNAPPAVTINTPVDGFAFPPAYMPVTVLVQASVTNDERIARIEYYANTNLIGTANSPPFGVPWGMDYSPPPGPYALVAKAVDNDGSYTLSQPVNIMVGPNAYCWGTRVLRGGQVMFYYAVTTGYVIWPWPAWVVSLDNLATNSVLQTLDNGGPGVTAIDSGPGVFVDESPPAAGQARFYTIYYEIRK